MTKPKTAEEKLKSNPVGRPPFYTSPEELEKKIDEYFKTGMATRIAIVGPVTNRITIEIPTPTITGLVRYCGFCDRHSFYDLEKQPEYTHAIKKARNRIEQHYEELLQSGLGVGAIFALKNFGWIDEHKVSGSQGPAPIMFVIPINELKKEYAERFSRIPTG